MIEYGFDMDGNRINLVLRTRTFKEITKQETSQTTESEKLHQKQPQEEINRMEEAALRRQQEEMAYQESMMEETEEAPISFQLVEIKPSFQGGDTNAFSKWVQENLTYPETAKKNGIYGRVTLQFTVNTDGTASDITVLRGVDPSLDKEAVRVVSMSPKWTPGKQDGHPVRVTYAFPVIFNLFNSE